MVIDVCRRLADTHPEAVADIVDEAVLRATGSAELFLETLRAIAVARGPEEAVSRALALEFDLVPANSPVRGSFDRFVIQQYVEWLELLLQQGAVAVGWNVYEEASARYPDDPRIHLRSVELALADANWRDAESSLDARTYPLSLSDTVKVLRSRISQLKSQEGKIVIRFRPGRRIIPVEATLNRRHRQDFFVDTGASMTTIPHGALGKLGIVITEDTPRHTVSTAGGMVQAYEVVIASIDIGGWEVNDIRALVLDVSGQPEVGLLGLNYLNLFTMEMNADAGVLTLEPR